MPRKRITARYPGASIFPVGLLGIKFSVLRISNRADISQHRHGSILYKLEGCSAAVRGIHRPREPGELAHEQYPSLHSSLGTLMEW